MAYFLGVQDWQGGRGGAAWPCCGFIALEGVMLLVQLDTPVFRTWCSSNACRVKRSQLCSERSRLPAQRPAWWREVVSWAPGHIGRRLLQAWCWSCCGGVPCCTWKSSHHFPPLLLLASVWGLCEDEALGGWWQYSLCMGKWVMLQRVQSEVKNYVLLALDTLNSAVKNCPVTF